MSKLVECKTCKKEVASGVSKCPHCGQSNPTVSTKQMVITLLILFFVVLFLMKACEDTPEEIAAYKVAMDERECNTGFSAKGFAQQFVKRNLKSPSTADFPFSGGDIKSLGDCRHLVTSYVDSQNGFGAMVRSQTQVLLRFDKTSGNWLLEDIAIN